MFINKCPLGHLFEFCTFYLYFIVMDIYIIMSTFFKYYILLVHINSIFLTLRETVQKMNHLQTIFCNQICRCSHQFRFCYVFVT